MTDYVEMLTSSNSATSSCCYIHPFTMSIVIPRPKVAHLSVEAHDHSEDRVTDYYLSPMCCLSACMMDRPRYGDLSWRSNLTVKVLTSPEDFSDRS